MELSTPPVLLVAFNRPDTTARVFETIRAARPARFYFACDGPRPSKPGEAELVAEVRQLASLVDWPCEFRTLFRSENLGCGRGVSSAISWFLAEAGEGIILEDDCLPSSASFEYFAVMLERYRHDQRIGLISGTNMVPEVDIVGDYGFSRIPTTWGWATWHRTWAAYNLVPEMVKEDEPWVRFFGGRFFRVVSRSFRRIHSGDVHTWDFQLIVQQMRLGQLTVIPRRNLIENIGFGGGGTHFTAGKRPWWAPTRSFEFRGDWRKELSVEPADAHDFSLKISCHGGGGKFLRACMKLRRLAYNFFQKSP